MSEGSARLGFVPLGVGDAFSSLHYSSCLAVESNGAWILVDCPHPIRKMMREASPALDEPLDVDRILGVVLTHLHADHSSGLEGFGYFCHFVLGRPARVLCHPEVASRLWEGHLAAGMERLMRPDDHAVRTCSLADYFQVVDLRDDRPVELGPFMIECRRTIHHVPTTALRIRAGGRCLGYSADTCFDPALIEWLSVADLIVHETNLGVHTPYESLAALGADLRARMRLIHYPDAFDLDASTIEPLRQGWRYGV